MYVITSACRCAGLNILPAPIHFYTEAQNVTMFKVLQIIISYIKRRSLSSGQKLCVCERENMHRVPTMCCLLCAIPHLERFGPHTLLINPSYR